MASATVPGFDVARFGFGFVNRFDKPFTLKTPVGRVSMGQNAGLCGGMTFASLDYYAFGRPAPDAVTDGLFDYLCDRQTDSLDLPAGVFLYLSWQAAPDSSTTLHGWRVREGVSHSTLVTEWPKVRALLDGGSLAPLGLIRTGSPDPKALTENHQVLAYGYELDEAAQVVTLRVCEPNYPRDGSITLRVGTANPDVYRPVLHSAEPGRPVRGFFLSNYVTPKEPPAG